MPPRIEPPPLPQYQPVQPQPVMIRPRAETARAVPADAGTASPAAETAHPAAIARTVTVRRPASTPVAHAGAAPQRAVQRPRVQAAPLLNRTVARAVPETPPASPTGGGVPVIEPIQQRMPERVVEMLNAQRGRAAITVMARAAAGVVDVATAPPAPAAEGPIAPAANIAQPRVAFEPAPMVRFAAGSAARPTFAAAAVTGEQVRQADARQSFQDAVRNRVALETQPMGGPTPPRAIIDQRV